VHGVANQINVLAPKIDPSRIRESIEGALSRQAEEEADRIKVRVMADGVVILSGTVRSWSERNAVERAASYTKGVVRVQDELTINSYS